ncbi:hypothetical protein AB4672_21015 [Bacillus paralicheniformis]
MKQENEKKTFSMRMLLNMVGLFVFTGMIVSAYTQAFTWMNISRSAALYT